MPSTAPPPHPHPTRSPTHTHTHEKEYVANLKYAVLSCFQVACKLQMGDFQMETIGVRSFLQLQRHKALDTGIPFKAYNHKLAEQ